VSLTATTYKGEEAKEKKGLTVKEVVKIFPKFKEKHISYFIKRGVISYPVSERDLEVLGAIYRIWGSSELVRFNLAYFSRKRKLELLRAVLNGCETSLEVWLYTRMKGKMERGEKVYIDEVVREAVSVWKLKKDRKVLEGLKKKAKQLRKKIYNEKNKKREK
jgi:hypothetical protein